MRSKNDVVTRIAPSPTGNLHVGTARSALFNYLYARKYGGKFIVRIEDTDEERSRKKFEADILDGLTWLNLKYDELYRQSERSEIYSPYIKTLVTEDKAYLSKETSKQNPKETIEVVRLRNPEKKITFTDEIRGEITFDTTELKDFVIARSVTLPLYHLAAVIDDEKMGITHVIRGEDHISNTPRQILIQEALGFSRPVYVHIPLILAHDRSKLSKRKGETSISKYAKEFLPGAIVNYLALLGWNPGTEQEIFSLDELVESFSLEKVQKGGAIFDIEKLKSINQQYLKKLSHKYYKEEIIKYVPDRLKNLDTYKEKTIDALVHIIQERVRTFKEAKEMLESHELDFYFTAPKLVAAKIAWKGDSLTTAKTHLEKVRMYLDKLQENNFTEEAVKNAVFEYASKEGRGSVLWPLRFVLTGLEKSPDPFGVAAAIGKKETLSRIQTTLETI